MPEMRFPSSVEWREMSINARLYKAIELVIEARGRREEAIARTTGTPPHGPTGNEKTSLMLLTNALRDAGYVHTLRPQYAMEWFRVEEGVEGERRIS